jgi:hypothetical protein
MRRFRWPGEAAVLVAIVYISRGLDVGAPCLDGLIVPRITAFLFGQGQDEDPHVLRTNSDASFIGTYPLGMGFTFDDTNKNGASSSIALMNQLIQKDEKNAAVIKPFIGGEEVLSDPTQSHHRYIIDFGDSTLAQAGQWNDLLQIVRDKVKPERSKSKDKSRREVWWKFTRRSPQLYEAIKDFSRVLVVPSVAKSLVFAFLPNSSVYDHQLIVFALQSHAAFAVLQSAVHGRWAAFFGSSLEERFRYTPSDVFETFPFPVNWGQGEMLFESGSALNTGRSQIMVQERQGLTSTYNRFNDPLDKSDSIQEMRRLHAVVDRAVLDSYGWKDISEHRSFETEWSEEDGKESVRFAWPQETNDEVLVRLLALNAEIHAEEDNGFMQSLLAEDRIAFAREMFAAPDISGVRSAAEAI